MTQNPSSASMTEYRHIKMRMTDKERRDMREGRWKAKEKKEAKQGSVP